MADVSAAQIEEFLRETGLIDPNYTGPVEVTATTQRGSETVTIKV
jgi:hypothetical protein